MTCSRCTTCNIYKPPRTFHCAACNGCILVHDHHCPWTGTCIGLRNHRYFLAFGYCTSFQSILALICDAIYLSRELPLEALVITLCIFTSLMICCVGGLSCYHSRLACLNLTTNEEIRNRYPNGNPHDQGFRANCRVFCQGTEHTEYVPRIAV